MNLKTKRLVVNGKHINYAVMGHGPALVFVHGWTNNWLCWIPLSRHLKKNYTLYLLDLPGFGDSDPLERYTIDVQTKFVSGFIRKMKLKPEAIVCHSMGAFLAANFAKEYPSYVKRIILIGATFRKGIRGFASRLFGRILQIVDGYSLAESAIKHIVESRTLTHILSKLINMYIYDRDAIDNYTMEGKIKLKKEAFVQMGVSIMNTRLENLLDGCMIPVLLIYGDHDNMCSVKTAKRFLAKKQGSFHFSTILNAGHSILEQPADVAQKIMDFVKPNMKIIKNNRGI